MTMVARTPVAAGRCPDKPQRNWEIPYLHRHPGCIGTMLPLTVMQILIQADKPGGVDYRDPLKILLIVILIFILESRRSCIFQAMLRQMVAHVKRMISQDRAMWDTTQLKARLVLHLQAVESTRKQASYRLRLRWLIKEYSRHCQKNSLPAIHRSWAMLRLVCILIGIILPVAFYVHGLIAPLLSSILYGWSDGTMMTIFILLIFLTALVVEIIAGIDKLQAAAVLSVYAELLGETGPRSAPGRMQ